MKKRLCSFFLAVCMLCFLTISACAMEPEANPVAAQAAGRTDFSDVPANAWYAAAVQYCQMNHLMSGTTDTTFAPSETTSRAMLVTVLYRQAGSPIVSSGSKFTDVRVDQWYSAAIAWASANDIVAGFDNNMFGVGDPVTREQLATILWQYVGRPAASDSSAFADQSSISAYATDAVRWAQSEGIVSGKDGNYFDPQGSATRADLAVILYRWLGSGTTLEPDTPQLSTNVLVAYFSRTGNTQDVAETVAELTGGDLFEIVPEQAYPSDYNAVLEQTQQELRDNARPALSSHVADMDAYDVILLGFPIWHGDTPMPVRSFLEEYDFSGKTIAPYSTSSSSGISAAVTAIRSLCPNANVADSLSITSSTLNQADTLAAEWLSGLGLTREKSRHNTKPPEAQEDILPHLTIKAGNQTFIATLIDNPTTRALLEHLPMTVSMGDLNGNEKYYYLPNDLPTASEQPGQIQTGDLMLYGSNCLVLFYETFSSSYSYTPLGQLEDPARLAQALGRGNIEVTFRMNENPR